MIGRNTITMNHATIRAALEMYLNSLRHPDAPEFTVDKVSESDRFNGLFEVETMCPVPEAKP